jgi:mRNA-degrading endonuclease RelE of RelBE toxin-antitoxin system
MFELIPTKFFLEQLDYLSDKSKKIISDKMDLIKMNPFRYKRIFGYGLVLFRIRFKDRGRNKRLIYLFENGFVKVLCILDRSKDYKDLRDYLRRVL